MKGSSHFERQNIPKTDTAFYARLLLRCPYTLKAERDEED